MNQDRRTQARIRVEIPIRLQLPGSESLVEAINRDLSWGGAQFLIGVPLSKDSGLLRITLPWKRGSEIAIDATVSRAQRVEDGRYLVAVRFVSISPHSQARLEKLLRLLNATSAQGEVELPPLVSELEVAVESYEDLGRMLQEIRTGRVSVTVFEGYKLDQSIRLTLAATDGLPAVRLRARVIEVKRHAAKDVAWRELYTLQLVFEHPLEAVRTFVDLLLDQIRLLAADSSDADQSEVPAWVSSVRVTRNAVAKPRPAPLRSEPSVLEARFPEVLGYLAPVWGDPDAFEHRFHELTMGSKAAPGGLPDDAWQEMGLLQDVHDLAYGRSSLPGRF